MRRGLQLSIRSSGSCRKTLALFLVLSLVLPLVVRPHAFGSYFPPARLPQIHGEVVDLKGRSPAAALEEPLFEASAPRASAFELEMARAERSRAVALRQQLRALRPAERKDFFEANHEDLVNLPADTLKTTIEEIYTPDISQRFAEAYKQRVAPLEAEANNPLRRSNLWSQARLDQSRAALAKWMLDEMGRDQIKQVERSLKRSYKDSKVVQTVSELTGSNDREKQAQGEAAKKTAQLVEESKVDARKNRTAGVIDLAKAHALPVAVSEASIPTKLRMRVNASRAKGRLEFTNPVMTTTVHLQAAESEKVVVELDRKFSDLALHSNFKYRLKTQQLTLELKKKITDEVSLDLASERYAGGKRGAQGEKRQESARLTYSISF